MKKRIVTLSVLALIIAYMSLSVKAHPGRTDGRGGHTDHSTGEYHYHHGYSAHDHYDMDGDGDVDCPYDFKDRTGANSHSSTNSSFSSSKKETEPHIDQSYSERTVSKKITFENTMVKIFLIFGVIICAPMFIVFGCNIIPPVGYIIGKLSDFFPNPDKSYRIIIRIVIISLEIFFIYKIVTLQ